MLAFDFDVITLDTSFRLKWRAHSGAEFAGPSDSHLASSHPESGFMLFQDVNTSVVSLVNSRLRPVPRNELWRGDDEGKGLQTMLDAAVPFVTQEQHVSFLCFVSFSCCAHIHRTLSHAGVAAEFRRHGPSAV